MRRSASALLVLLAGCGPPPELRDLPRPTRGVVLLVVSGLRADAVTAERAPFLADLAGRGLAYEWAVAPAASTLATQAALATGLHPGELGLDHVLLRPGAEIETLAERFARFGFATGGFTEGGFVSRAWGFGRGFDTFSDPTARDPGATARTLERATAFLDELPAGRRFLLFVHTAALAPPWLEGSAFAAARQGRAEPAPEELRAQQAAYEAALTALDGELARFFDGLERRGLLAETTVAVTADHGEEFREHGRLGHDQLYPQVTRVPLVLLHPEIAPRRVARLVRTADLLPTLSLMGGLPPSLGLVGGRLPTPLAALTGPPAALAWAETFGSVLQRSVWLESAEAGGGPSLHQIVETRAEAERDGTWINRSVAFDVQIPTSAPGLTDAGGTPALELRLVSFAEERLLEVRVDGERREDLAIPRRWRTVQLPMAPGSHRIELATTGCAVPAELGMGDDPRCLSFKVEQPPLRRIEIFDLRADPGATNDLSSADPALRVRLEALLATVPSRPVARPERLQRSPAIRAYLNSLGYLEWGG